MLKLTIALVLALPATALAGGDTGSNCGGSSLGLGGTTGGGCGGGTTHVTSVEHGGGGNGN